MPRITPSAPRGLQLEASNAALESGKKTPNPSPRQLQHNLQLPNSLNNYLASAPSPPRAIASSLVRARVNLLRQQVDAFDSNAIGMHDEVPFGADMRAIAASSLIAAPRDAYCLELKLIKSGQLDLVHVSTRPTVQLHFSREPREPSYKTPDETLHWYRAMSTDEFEQMRQYGIVRSSDYAGIAPFHKYAKRYLTNTSSATHIVEFGPDPLAVDPLNIHHEFSERKFSTKAENGCLSYGLGEKGSKSPLNVKTVQKFGKAGKDVGIPSASSESMKSPADLMTQWIASGRLKYRIVDVRLPGLDTAEAEWKAWSKTGR